MILHLWSFLLLVLQQGSHESGRCAQGDGRGRGVKRKSNNGSAKSFPLKSNWIHAFENVCRFWNAGTGKRPLGSVYFMDDGEWIHCCCVPLRSIFLKRIVSLNSDSLPVLVNKTHFPLRHTYPSILSVTLRPEPGKREVHSFIKRALNYLQKGTCLGTFSFCFLPGSQIFRIGSFPVAVFIPVTSFI